MMINPAPGAGLALDLLHQAGHQACLVGGYVRDVLLGRGGGDVDIATSAWPEQTRAVFSAYKTIDTGLAHGTLTVLVQGESLEITTFRREGKYSDGRRPDEVFYTQSLMEDLARRDFTMNALAFCQDKGLVDPFGGQEDMQGRLIRAVGRPLDRFYEDALRILRGLRFACQLGFAIEDETYQAMLQAGPGLKGVSAERVAQELSLMLMAEHAQDALWAYAQVLALALPELLPLMEDAAAYKQHLQVLSACPPHLPSRWAALFSFRPPAASAQLLEAVLLRLKSSKKLREEASLLSRHLGDEITMERLPLYASRLGQEATRSLLHLQQAQARADLDQAKLESISSLMAALPSLLAAGRCPGLADLRISGADLLQMGFPRGPELSQTLNQLLEEVLLGQLANERDALWEAAKNRKPG